MQTDQKNYRTMLFMSKQVCLPKISSILQKVKIGQNKRYTPFLHEGLQLLWCRRVTFFRHLPLHSPGNIYFLLNFFRDAGAKCPVDNERLSESQVSRIFLAKSKITEKSIEVESLIVL